MRVCLERPLVILILSSSVHGIVVKSIKTPSIIDEEIEDNFLEYIDSKQLRFSSKMLRIKDKFLYECTLSISLKDPEILDQISSKLLVLSKRLINKHMEVNIMSISIDKIVFTASMI